MSHIEYEATFFPVKREGTRAKLKTLCARCTKEEVLMTRAVYDAPEICLWNDAFVRVRDEGDKITLTLKSIPTGGSDDIKDQKEIETTIDSFEVGRDFVTKLGMIQKAFQESRREVWMIDDVEIMIDEWPWLPVFVEIEGQDEVSVRKVSEDLGFAWGDAVFGPVNVLYERQYGVDFDTVNSHPSFRFEDPNPFV